MAHPMAHPASLSQLARRLAVILDRETGLARAGNVAELARVADAKREAFEAFRRVWSEHEAVGHAAATDREALRQLLAAVNENALVLEAVHVTLQDMAARLRTALRSVADPGTYHLRQPHRRHVQAAQIDASA
jgi:hypothetical protein